MVVNLPFSEALQLHWVQGGLFWERETWKGNRPDPVNIEKAIENDPMTHRNSWFTKSYNMVDLSIVV